MDQRFLKNAGGSLILGHNKRGYYRKCLSITNYFNFQIFISSRTIDLMPRGYFHKPLIKNLLCKVLELLYTIYSICLTMYSIVNQQNRKMLKCIHFIYSCLGDIWRSYQFDVIFAKKLNNYMGLFTQ